MREERVPVVFAVDVEPDDPEFEPGERAPWRGFLGCVELAERIRETLGKATGTDVALTWFLRMDPQVTEGYGSPGWAAETYGAQFASVRAANDELGLHVHSWRWLADQRRWSADLTDDAWLAHCVDVAFDAYNEAFHEPCRAHRAGDRFMSNRLLEMLKARGVEVDLTPEPGLRGIPISPGRPHTAAIPDMAHVPRRPYFPATSDWQRPSQVAPAGVNDLLMIPLASADLGQLLSPLRAAARRVRNVGRPLNRPLLPWAPGIGPRMWDVIAADVRSGDLTALCFAMRSDIGVNAAGQQTLMDSIAMLARHELVGSLAFVTASHARASITARPEKLAVA